MGRWLGGVFGNTKLATDPQADVTGRYTISDQYYMRQEGGWTPPPEPGDQALPAVRVSELTSAGRTQNGFYWFKGQGAADNTAKQYYCILDSNFPLGAGWVIIANHDGAKTPKTAHQARPTGHTNYIGYDGDNGTSNVQGHPPTEKQTPDRSFSVDAKDLVWQTFVHAAFGTASSATSSTVDSSTWMTIQAYYAVNFNSNQTIGNNGTWVKIPDSTDYTVNSYQRRLFYSGGSSSYAINAIGVMNDNSTNTHPYVNGSGAGTQDYPVYVGSFDGNGGGTTNAHSATFSWCDSSTTSSGTNDPTGWDDFQDGSGMGDGWSVDTNGQNMRGYPSFILVK